MTTRTYFANSVGSALAEARREAGEEAVLLNAGPTSERERTLGAYMVVVATEKPSSPAANPRHAALARELIDVRHQLRRLSAALGASPQSHPLWWERLISSGIPEDLAAHWIRDAGLPADLPSEPDEVPPPTLLSVLRRRVAFTRGFSRPVTGRHVVAAVGPSGAGKTSFLAKFAFRYAPDPSIRIAILSTDSLRVGAAETWSVPASILNVPFQLLSHPSEFEPALDAHSDRNLILLDTPGYGPDEDAHAAAWARCWQQHDELDTQLVLNAQVRTADLLSAAARWARFRPRSLAFTRLDETTALGGVLAVAAQTQIPLSFYSAGQQVPESLVEADAESLLRRILQDPRETRAAAA